MTKKPTKSLFLRITVVLLILAINVCFVVSLLVIESISKKECFNHIEETTEQTVGEFKHVMEQNKTQLVLFADILAANSENPDEQLKKYMEHFCKTQNFSAVCVHRPDNTTASHGFHVHEGEKLMPFEVEKDKVPYNSEIFEAGDKRSENYFYIAVPVLRENSSTGNMDTVAVLYGYISLDTVPGFISSTAYDKKAQFYIVDGKTGKFIMDEYHRYDVDGDEKKLGDAINAHLSNRETKDGYTINGFYHDIEHCEKGYVVFRVKDTKEWFYNYYMPLGINSWSMLMMIDEGTAFATYGSVRNIMFLFMGCVLIVIVALTVIVLMRNAKIKKANNESLHKADYLNSVQSALISAHNNPDFVDQALKIVAEEVGAETALLLTFSDKIISHAQYWPSKDKSQAMALIGINIREVFPSFFDLLSSNSDAFYDGTQEGFELSESSSEIFKALEVSNIMLVPIMDNIGVLKGAIAVVNLPDNNEKSVEMLKCVTRDFFMAMTNLENHNIIKTMGEMDYLTGLKNRNSYEAEISNYETVEAESLWCVFIDANGLHHLNNEKGHKAGDEMLCSVADAVKKIFGVKDSYRLGGDEFVAFKENSSHEEFMGLKHRLLSEVKRKGYSISAGFKGVFKNENGVFDVEKVVTDAEEIMYRDKWEYYEKNNIPTDRGHFPKMTHDEKE